MRASAVYTGIVVPSFVVLPIVAALFKTKYWKAPQRLSFFYLVLSGVFNIIAKITAVHQINNLPFLHLYTILEFVLLCAFFKSIFIEARLKKVITGIMVVFPLIALGYIFSSDALLSYNPLPRFLEGLILMLFCIYFLMQDLNRLEYNHSMFSFTIVVGMLLYFSSSLILFALPELIRENKDMNRLIWSIHATFVLMMYLSFAVAFIKLKKE
jgi:hypothetical protein